MGNQFDELRKIVRKRMEGGKIDYYANAMGISKTTLRDFAFHDRNVTLLMACILMDYFKIEVKFIEK